MRSLRLNLRSYYRIQERECLDIERNQCRKKRMGPNGTCEGRSVDPGRLAGGWGWAGRERAKETEDNWLNSGGCGAIFLDGEEVVV